MQRGLLIRALAVGAMCAGVIPAVTHASSPPTSPPTSAGGEDPYCAAHLALEAATSGDDPAAIDAAVQAAKAVATPEVSAAIDAALASAPGEDSPIASPEFAAAYGTLVEYVREYCGFAELSVLAKDYSFGGIGGEVAAGPTIIDLDNQGTEFHEMIMFRRNEGVTESVDELMALPQDELFGKITFAAAIGGTAPGTVGSSVADLAPGEYIALCFISQGSTPEAMAAQAAGATVPGPGSVPTGSAASVPSGPAESVPSVGAASVPSGPAGSVPTGSEGGGGEGGPPHFVLGMVVEFTVVEGGTTDTGSMGTAMDTMGTAMDNMGTAMDTMGTEMATATTAAG